MPDKPNMLIIMSDQHHAHVMGCEGDQIIRTPNLDSLAANGTLFEQCYTPAPLCVPARMSFMTSRYPYRIECPNNYCFLGSDYATFAHALGAAGYETILDGRMHFNGPDQRHGFEKRFVGDVTGPYIGCGLPALNSELLSAASQMTTVQTSGPGRTGYQLFDEDVTDAAIKYFKEYAEHSGRPFCMVVGYVLPHCPFVCPEEDWEYYLNKMELPHIPEGYFENAHPAVKQWRKAFNVEGFTDNQIRWARTGYYGIVAHMDRQIGRLLNALRETGLADDTVVVYTSDHGEAAGEHGLWGKMQHFEGATSVPLIFSWPGHIPSGARLPQITNLVDIGQTLIELAGGEQLDAADGHSLLPLMNGQTDWDDETFSEFPAGYGMGASRMIRRGPWKLIHYDGMKPMLFNIEEDPGEFHDLGEQPQYLSLVNELMARILDGWSAERVNTVCSRYESYIPIHLAWYNAVQPPCPELWSPPPGTNNYTIWGNSHEK